MHYGGGGEAFVITSWIFTIRDELNEDERKARALESVVAVDENGRRSEGGKKKETNEKVHDAPDTVKYHV